MNRLKIVKTAAPLCATLLLGAPTLFGGIQHIQAPSKGAIAPVPPPARDCDGCIEPGFYANASLLYLHAFNSEIPEFDGEWDAGVRAALGWESPSGLFLELTGFYHQTDISGSDAAPGDIGGEFEFFYLDGTIGDTIHCGELCVSVAGGLRYARFVFDEDWAGMPQKTEFDGIGPVFAVEATRALSDTFSLYAHLRQSLLFGQSDFNGFEGDSLASVTEVGAGIQIDFDLGSLSGAFARLGFEGQYWHVDAASVGLAGGVLTVGTHF